MVNTRNEIHDCLRFTRTKDSNTDMVFEKLPYLIGEYFLIQRYSMSHVQMVKESS